VDAKEHSGFYPRCYQRLDQCGAGDAVDVVFRVSWWRDGLQLWRGIQEYKREEEAVSSSIWGQDVEGLVLSYKLHVATRHARKARTLASLLRNSVTEER
jgi:hypothetical protein